MSLNRQCYHYIIQGCLILGLGAGIFVGQYWVVRWMVYYQTTQQMDIQSQTMNSALESLFQESFQVLDDMQRFDVNTAHCDENLINELKLLQFHHYVIQNVTLVFNDEFICSSVLGMHINPLLSLSTDWTTGGRRYWFQAQADVYSPTKHHVIIEQGPYRINVHLQMVFLLLNSMQELGFTTQIQVNQHVIASSDDVNEYFPHPDDRVKQTVSSIKPFSSVIIASAAFINARIHSLFMRTLWFGVILWFVFGSVFLDYYRRWYHSFPHQFNQGLKRQDIQPYFQPIIDSRTDRCVGAELLCRWRMDGQWVSPDWFIPQIEALHREGELTRYLLLMAFKLIGHTLSTSPRRYLSFNVSVSVLLEPSFFSWLERVRQKAGLNASQLRLELTERQFADKVTIISILNQYRKAGYLIYVDDFGTGYSSLAYLQDLPLDVLKIDKSFIDAIETGRATSPVTPHIVAMAQSLGLMVIAEGVESISQRDYLSEMGVFLLQGWLYSPAISGKDFHQFCLVCDEYTI